MKGCTAMHQALRGAVPFKSQPQQLVKRLSAGERMSGFFLSEALWGVHTHWLKEGKRGRSVRCTKERGACVCEERDLPSRWRGYIHVYDEGTREFCFLELTPGAAEQLLRQLPDRENLRGIRFEAYRTPGGDTGRLNIRLGTHTVAIETCPPGQDPEPVLEKLWSLTLRD